MDKFIVGSKAFFEDMPGFKPHDNDVLILSSNPNPKFSVHRQLHVAEGCLFEWLRLPKDYLIEYHKQQELGMLLGKFLVPEFVKEINFTISDLKELSCLVDKLDDKHLYEKIIFDSYIENDDFYLTDEQRQKAYDEYLKYR